MNKNIYYFVLLIIAISCKSNKYKSSFITNYIYTNDSNALYTKRLKNNIGVKLIIDDILKNKKNDFISNQDTNIVLFGFHSFSPSLKAYYLTKKDTLSYEIKFDYLVENKSKKLIIVHKGIKGYKYNFIINKKLSNDEREFINENINIINNSQINPINKVQFDGIFYSLYIKIWGEKTINFKHYNLMKNKKINPSKTKIYFIN